MSGLAIEEGSTPHSTDFIRVATLEELKTAGMVVVRGARCPLLVVYDEHGGIFDHVPPPNCPPDQFTALYARFTAQACSKKVKGSDPLIILPVRPGAGTPGRVP